MRKGLKTNIKAYYANKNMSDIIILPVSIREALDKLSILDIKIDILSNKYIKKIL